MARPRKADAAPPARLSGGQASYVLERLLKERRVNQTEIGRYVGEMKREIGELEERLKSLRDAVGDAASAAVSGIASAASNAMAAVRGRKPGRPAGSKNKPGRPPGRPAGTGRKPGRPPKAVAAASAAVESAPTGGAKRGRKKAAITAEQLASRQLQGRYLALVRRFPASKRAAFAKTAKDRGREAAIKEMQDGLPKK
jgi:hypothetical protein